MRIGSRIRPTLFMVGLAIAMSCDGSSTGPDGNPIVTVFATGLRGPQGIEVDAQGNVWVAEQGTGNADARISVITPAGVRHTVIDGMPSIVAFGNPEGVHHLLLDGTTLWGAQGLEATDEGNLIRIDLTGWLPGDAPFTLDDLVVEELGPFILAADPTGTGATNLYNLAFGFGGDIFLVDAAANAVIRRRAAGDFEIFAALPEVTTPPGGQALTDAVPTGIAFDGSRLLVSALSGFPFNPGAARVFAIGSTGTVTEHRTGLTSAVDIALDPAGRLVVAEYAEMPGGTPVPGTGKVVRLTDQGIETIVEGLSTTTGIAFASADVLYVSDMSAGTVLKVTF